MTVKRSSSSTTAVASNSSPLCAPAIGGAPSAVDVGELALQCIDVLVVHFDCIFVRLQPFQYPGVVFLVARADLLLLGKLALGIGEQGFLLLQLSLERRALLVLGSHPIGARFLREILRRLRGALAGRHDGDALLLHDAALLSDRILLLVGQDRAAILVL